VNKVRNLVIVVGALCLPFLACEDKITVQTVGETPSVVLIQAPAQVYQSPAQPVGIHVRVEDPQGTKDVAGVTLEVRNENGEAIASHEMADDGKGGDILAGDAQYYLPVDTALTHNQTGRFILEAVARDRAGHTSSPASDTLTILPGVENRLPSITSLLAPDTVWSDSTYAPQFLVTVSDPDGIATIRYVLLEIYPPAFPAPAIVDTLRDDGQSGDGEPGDGKFGSRLKPSVLGNNCGKHIFVFRPVDGAGGVGFAASRTIHVSLVHIPDNSPPQVFDLVAPATISRSAPRNNYLLSIRASDPDSVCGDDIARVFFNSFLPSGTPATNNPFLMRDDGKQGDVAAGDGRYSLTISISQEVATGEFRFEFQAEDKNGALSEKLIHKLTVTP